MYLIDIKRTPIGKFLGSLSTLSAVDLGLQLISYFVHRYPLITETVINSYIGNVLSTGLGQNPAKQLLAKSKIKSKSTAFTINQVCGSGLTSIIEGYKSIILKETDIALCGGIESMSNAPYYMTGYRKGNKMGDDKLKDSLINDGLYCNIAGKMMYETAESLAKKYNVSRVEMDKYAYESNSKALKAIDSSLFKEEIIPIKISEKVTIAQDEQPRRDTSVEKLSKLKTLIKDGSITAGNSSSINDGAALALLASESAVNKYSLTPIAEIIGYDFVGVEAEYMGIAPYYSIRKLLKKLNININDIDLFEINEAFAAQILPVIRLLNINQNKVNILGGAIALGHPLGASGARILTTLVYNLRRSRKQMGIASLCIGGGQGVTILIRLCK